MCYSIEMQPFTGSYKKIWLIIACTETELFFLFSKITGSEAKLFLDSYVLLLFSVHGPLKAAEAESF